MSYELCPRCNERPMRRVVTALNGDRVEIPGAVTRADGGNEICSACGFDEAMLDYDGTHHQPVSEWPVKPKYHALYDEVQERSL